MARSTLVLMGWCALAPVRGSAQEQGDAAAYEASIAEGIEAYQQRHFAEARALLGRAHAVQPSARTLRAIGMTEFELRHYREAAVALSAALASAARALDDRQRSETEQLLQRAENFITHVHVESTPVVRSVRVDGEEVALNDGELLLAVGDHVLEFAAPGYLNARRRIRAVGGEALRIALALEPLTVTPLAQWQDESKLRAFAAPQQDEVGLGARSKWILSLSVVVAAALAAGLGFGLSGRAGVTEEPVAAAPIAIERGP